MKGAYIGTIVSDFNKILVICYMNSYFTTLVDGKIVYNDDNDNVNIGLIVKPFGKYHLLLKETNRKKIRFNMINFAHIIIIYIYINI